VTAAKAAFGAALAGSLAAAPLVALIAAAAPSEVPPLLSPQWELDSDTLALSCALFGASTSRLPLSSLPQLVLVAATLRASAHIHASAGCTAPPLNCGPPLSYLDGLMAADAAITWAVGLFAFSAAAFAVRMLARSPA
jgi:hypothetical protein